jgi:hypothetical protein
MGPGNQPPTGAWQQPPPPSGWNQPPPAGWHAPPPPPPPVVRRIPEDQPFIARHSAGKRGVLFGGAALVVAVLVSCAPLLAGETLIGLVGAGAVAVLTAVLLGLHLYLLASGGPALAIGPAGLWIKTRPTRGQAIWLPWEAIERIYVRRWVFDKMLCVKPRDPRAGTHLGTFTALDSGMQQLVFGTGLTAPLNFADRPETEIMGAVAHFSAGRVRIG